MKAIISMFLIGVVLISTCGQQKKMKVGNAPITGFEITLMDTSSTVLSISMDSVLVVTDSLKAIKMLLHYYLETNEKYINCLKKQDSLAEAYLDYKNKPKLHW